MDIHSSWKPGKQLAGWISPSGRFEPMIILQGNAAALASLSDIFGKLAKTQPGERITIDGMTGLNAGDIALTMEHTNLLAAPPSADLLETRVAVPGEGDTVIWAQVPESRREDVVRLMIAEAGHTSLQAREAIARSGSCFVRTAADIAARLRDALRKLAINALLFELHS